MRLRARLERVRASYPRACVCRRACALLIRGRVRLRFLSVGGRAVCWGRCVGGGVLLCRRVQLCGVVVALGVGGVVC